MRLMSLNTWAGREFDSLMKYISEHNDNIDVFCFQEVFDNDSGIETVDYVSSSNERVKGATYRANLFHELGKILPNHEGYFAPIQNDFSFDPRVDFPLSWGVAMFIRDTEKLMETGDIQIYRERNSGTDSGTIPRNLQYAVIEQKGIRYFISHFHGLWNGQGKTDTPERIEQSRNVKEFVELGDEKLILCGDFNLLPDTESLNILENIGGGLVNLIKENNIKSTRSSLYTKHVKFADYTLVSPDINVRNFEVPNVNASDHLPMILDFY